MRTYDFAVSVEEREQVLLYQLSCVARERHEVFPRGVLDPVAFPLDLELDLLALQVDAVVQNFLDFVPLLVAVVH